jgi:hypothetical protein
MLPQLPQNVQMALWHLGVCQFEVKSGALYVEQKQENN